jgi:hypothetical protein
MPTQDEPRIALVLTIGELTIYLTRNGPVDPFRVTGCDAGGRRAWEAPFPLAGGGQMVLLATLVGELSVPAVSIVMTAKNQVPEGRLLIVAVVAVGLLTARD